MPAFDVRGADELPNDGLHNVSGGWKLQTDSTSISGEGHLLERVHPRGVPKDFLDKGAGFAGTVAAEERPDSRWGFMESPLDRVGTV